MCVSEGVRESKSLASVWCTERNSVWVCVRKIVCVYYVCI